MAIPLLGLIPKIIKTAANILGVDSVKDVVDAIEGSKLTPEQRVALETAAQQYSVEIRQLDIEELKTVLTESIAEIQSPDKFVSRARPTGLYIFYGVSSAIAIGMLFGVKIDPTAVLTILGPLAGVGGTYVYKRTQEKLGANGNSE
jgi:hypothetical protein